MRFSRSTIDSLSYPRPLQGMENYTYRVENSRNYRGNAFARGGVDVSYLSASNLPSPLINRLFPLEDQISHSFASKIETRQKLSPFPTFLSRETFRHPVFPARGLSTSKLGSLLRAKRQFFHFARFHDFPFHRPTVLLLANRSDSRCSQEVDEERAGRELENRCSLFFVSWRRRNRGENSNTRAAAAE